MADSESQSTTDSAKSLLQKDVAGMPVWVWGAAVLAGLGLSFYLYNRSSGNVDNTGPRIKRVEDVSSYPGVGRSASGWSYSPPPPDNPDKPQSFANNTEWGRYVIDQLIAQGYDPELVDESIRTYLSNLPLTDAQQTIVDIALSKFGSPPSLIGPPSGENHSGYDLPTREYSNPERAGDIPAPTNLEAVALSPFQVKLTFDEPDPPAPRYRVYSNHAMFNIGVTQDNVKFIGGLQPDTDYQFWVAPLDKNGHFGETSAPVSVHTPPASQSDAGDNLIQQGGPFTGGVTVPPPQGFHTVTVSGTDSLASVARRTLGSAHLWPRIYNVNRDKLSNPDSLTPGMQLRIPR